MSKENELSDIENEIFKYEKEMKISFDAGNYKNALMYAKILLETREKLLPPDHHDIVELYDIISAVHYYMDNYQEALTYLTRVLEIREKLLPPDHSDIAESHHYIGNTYYRLNKYDDAVMHYIRELKIIENNSTTDQTDIAWSHRNIGDAYYKLDNYADALKHHINELAIRENILPADHQLIAELYDKISVVHYRMDNYQEALTYLTRALEIRENALPPYHIDIAASHCYIGYICSALSKYDEALMHLIRELEIRENNSPLDYTAIAWSHRNIGNAYYSLGKYSEALKHNICELEIRENILPHEYHEIARLHNKIGSNYDRLGNYEEALKHHIIALDICEKNFQSTDLQYIATAHNKIGILYYNIGIHEEALKHYYCSLEIREKVFQSTDHPDIAMLHHNIGMAYNDLNNYEEALKHYACAQEIYEKVFKFREHEKIAATYSGVGLTCFDLGDYGEALKQFESALDIYKNILEPENNNIATLYSNIGSVYANFGEKEKSLTYFKRAVEIFKNTLPPEHPYITQLHENICMSYYHYNYMEAAIIFTNRMIHILSTKYLNIMKTFSQTLRKRQLQSIKNLMYIIHTVALVNSAKIEKREMYDLLLKSKDIDAEAERIIRPYNNPERYPEYADRLKQLKEKQNLYQHLLLNELDKKEQIEKLNSEIHKLEIPLVSKIPEINFKHHMAGMTTNKVLEKIKDGQALIEYGWFYYTKSAADTRSDIKSGGRYYAYLLCNRNITFRYLEAEDAIHANLYSAIEKIVPKEISPGEYSTPLNADEELSNLYHLLVAPFADELIDIEHLYISPDGELYKLPFELLRDDYGKTLASEEVSVSYLSSGRDLVYQEGGCKPITDYTSMAIIADPKFDLPDGYKRAGNDNSGKLDIVSRQSNDFDNLKVFEPIPYTKVEADAIDRVFTGSKTKKYGLEAKKNTLSKIGSPNIIHISTHGFAREKQELPEYKLKMSLQGDLPHNRANDPLIRCGLAFSGANTFLKSDRKEQLGDYDDGILTAKDVLSLDLPETDLLVLSACQTALGEVRNGEGIQGMRRAFGLAGVRTMICTLWSVSDASSAILMEEFYKRLFKNKDMNKLRALAEAKKHVKTMTNSELIKYLINNDITDEVKKKEFEDIYSNSTDAWKKERPYEHPYFWAGYILQGDTSRTQT